MKLGDPTLCYFIFFNTDNILSARPLFLYLCLFNIVDSTQMFYIKVWIWLVSNRWPLVSEATALPTEPQPLSKTSNMFVNIILWTGWILKLSCCLIGTRTAIAITERIHTSAQLQMSTAVHRLIMDENLIRVQQTTTFTHTDILYHTNEAHFTLVCVSLDDNQLSLL